MPNTVVQQEALSPSVSERDSHSVELQRWFAAHLLFSIELDGTADQFPARESIVLLCAPTEAEAEREAERIGASKDGAEVECPQGYLRYVGVRKLSAIEGQPGHAMELTSMALELDEEADLDRLLDRDFVKPVFEW